MKKYFFFAATALLALGACTKVTPVEEPEQEISFKVVNYVNATKADAQNHLEYTGTFGVFAYANTDAWADAQNPTANVYMNNVQISKTNDGWKASSPYFWPKQAKLTFAAYSPYKESAPTFAKATGFTFTNYEIPLTADEDLMVADVQADLTGNVTTSETADAVGGYHFATGVPILFHHLLTSLQFKFQQAPYNNANVNETSSKITVTKVELVNFIGKKTYTNEAWATNSNSTCGDVTYTVYDAGQGASTEIAKKSASNPTQLGNDDIMIMPQTLVNKAENSTTSSYQLLRVTYNISTVYNHGTEDTNDDTTLLESGIVSVVPFYYAGSGENNEGEIIEFKKNQKIVYTVTIVPYAQDEIFFDPAVKNWDESTGTLTVE